MKEQHMVKRTDTEGLIFKIRRFSIHDGPGIRTTVFLKSCPLNCIWCHSPEGISRDITIWHNNTTCIACGLCVNACPEKALKLTGKTNGKIDIDRTKCNLNGTCLEVCPTGSIQYTGMSVTAGRVVTEVEKDIVFFNESGGGITLTGGEPMAQPEFSCSLLETCLEKGINTAVETSLFCERHILERFARVTQLFIADIKIFDPGLHKKYTGQSNEIILDNFRYLAGKGHDLLVRIPLVPGITDNDDNLMAVNEFVGSVRPNIPVELIKYNSLAPNNYRKLNLPYLVP